MDRSRLKNRKIFPSSPREYLPTTSPPGYLSSTQSRNYSAIILVTHNSPLQNQSLNPEWDIHPRIRLAFWPLPGSTGIIWPPATDLGPPLQVCSACSGNSPATLPRNVSACALAMPTTIGIIASTPLAEPLDGGIA